MHMRYLFMKRIVKIMLITFVVLVSLSFVAFAAPDGFLEVKLNTKNFSNYFEIKKHKYYNGKEYTGYVFDACSKLLKKGYYIYDLKGVVIEGTAKVRAKVKKHKTSYKSKFQNSYGTELAFGGAPPEYDYKYGKVWDVKITKAKGSVIFIKPDNVISVKKEGSVIIIKLRKPYDKNTSHEIDDENDYYYCEANMIEEWYISK